MANSTVDTLNYRSNTKSFNCNRVILLFYDSRKNEKCEELSRFGYELQLSVWSSCDERLSGDITLAFISKDEKKMMFLNDPSRTKKLFVFVNLVHRSSGIPVGCGSHSVDWIEHCKADSKNCSLIFESINLDLAMNNNINRIQSSVKWFNSPLSLQLEIASFTSNERLISGTDISFNGNSLHNGLTCTLLEIPTVAHSDCNLLSCSNRILFSNSQTTNNNNRNGRLTINALTSSGVSQSGHDMDETLSPPRCYVTIEDVQLAPDILDLYAKWNVLVTGHVLSVVQGGGGGEGQTSSYLGYINNYEGHWIEQAVVGPLLLRGSLAGASLQIEVSIAECAASTDMTDGRLEVARNMLCSGVLLNNNIASPLVSGRHEVTLFTDLSRDHSDEQSVGSFSSLRGRIFVGRVVLHLVIMEPATSVDVTTREERTEMDTLIDLSIDQVDVLINSRSVVFRLRFMYYCCDQISFLTSQASNSRQELVSEDELLALKASLFAIVWCLLHSLSRLQFVDSGTHAELLLGLSLQSDTQRSVLTSLNAYFEDWLTSDLLSELIAAQSSASLFAIQINPLPSHNAAQHNAHLAEQLRNILRFNNSDERNWSIISAAFFYLQMLGELSRTGGFSTSAKSRLIDTAFVADMSQDLLLALLGYCTIALGAAETVLTVLSEDSASVSLRDGTLCLAMSCLDCVSMLVDNMQMTDPAVETAVVIFCAAILKCVDTSMLSKLNETNAFHLSTYGQLVLLWGKMFTLLTRCGETAELGMNVSTGNYTSSQQRLCSHIVKTFSVTPLLADFVRCDAELTVSVLTTMAALVRKVTSGCEPFDQEPGDSSSTLLASMDEDETEESADFQYSGILKTRVTGQMDAEDRHQFQIPSHSRRANYKPASNVTFALDKTNGGLSVRESPAKPPPPRKVSDVLNIGDKDAFSSSGQLFIDTGVSPRGRSALSVGGDAFSFNGMDGRHSGTMLLCFLGHNRSQLEVLLDLLNVILLLQPRNPSVSVGLVRALSTIGSLVDTLLNSLFKGRELSRSIVKRVYEALSSISGPSSAGLLSLIQFVAKYESSRAARLANTSGVRVRLSYDILLSFQQQVATYSNFMTVLYTKVQTDVALGRSAVTQYLAQKSDGSAAEETTYSHSLIELWFSARESLLEALHSLVRHANLLLTYSSHSDDPTHVSGMHHCLLQFVMYLCNLSFMKHIASLRPEILRCIFTLGMAHDTTRSMYYLAEELSCGDKANELARARDALLLTVLKKTVLHVNEVERSDAVSFLFQLIESSTYRALAANVESALFLELTLRTPLSRYVTTVDRKTSDKEKISSGSTGMLMSLSRLFVVSTMDSEPVLNNLKLGFALHLQAVKQVIYSKVVLKESSQTADEVNGSRVQFDRMILSSALSEIIFRQFVSLSSRANDNPKERLARLDNVLQLMDELQSLRTDQNAVAVTHAAEDHSLTCPFLMCVGCDDASSLHLLRLVVTSERNQLVGLSTDLAAQSEGEIHSLRGVLRTCLSSGQWERGVVVANKYLEKFRNGSFKAATESVAFTPKSILNSPLPLRSALSSSSATITPFSPQGGMRRKASFDSFYGANVVETNTPPVTPMRSVVSNLIKSSTVPLPQSPQRTETMQKELLRTIDKLRDKIKSDDKLRLFPVYYALRFLSDQPWERCHSQNSNEEIARLLAGIDVEGLNLTSVQWFNAAPTVSTDKDQGESSTRAPLTASYEYWLVLRMDMTSSVEATKFYKRYLDECRTESSPRSFLDQVPLISPTSHQALQRQVVAAFPSFCLLSSHHAIESYISRKYSQQYGDEDDSFGLKNSSSSSESKLSQSAKRTSNTSSGAHSCKYMQLFQAFPRDICEDVHDSMHLALPDDDSEKQPPMSLDLDQLLQAADKNDARLVASLTRESDDKYFASVGEVRSFFTYSILSEEEIAFRKQTRSDGAPSKDSAGTDLTTLEYINRYELSLGDLTVSTARLSGDSHAEDSSDDVTILMASISPISSALLTRNTSITIVHAALEAVYYYKTVALRAHQAIIKLNHFGANELTNEPVDDVINSFTVFVGTFTLLSNIFAMPNISCVGLHNIESIVMAEREREEIEWQQYRKRAKKQHMRKVQEYEDAPRSNKKPFELDMSALKVEFDLLTGNRDVERLDVLRRQIFSIMNETMKEMRKFIDKSGTKTTVLSHETVRQIAIKKGRRPTIANHLMFSKASDNMANGSDDEDEAEDEKSLKSKLCLFVESLYAAVEIGIAL